MFIVQRRPTVIGPNLPDLMMGFYLLYAILLILTLSCRPPAPDQFTLSPQCFYNMPHVELNMTARSYDAPINDNTSIFLWFRVSKHRLLGRSTLSFDGKSHRLTLLLIAGVEPNPGPAIRRTCGTCVRTIARNHRSVLCQDCNMHYHIKCNNISAAEYANIKGRMKYVTCINCKASKTQSDTYQDFNHAQSSDSHTNPMDLKLPRGLRICNMNIQGFRSSQDSFKLSMAPMTFDCIGICETNLPRKFSDGKLKMPGYHMPERKHGCGRLNHGILLYVKNNLTVKRRQDLESDDVDALWCEVRLPKTKPILIGSIYRSPSGKIDHSEKLEKSITSALDCGLETVIMGDVNHDVITGKRDAPTKRFVEFTRQHQLTQVVKDPTRVTEKNINSHRPHLRKSTGQYCENRSNFDWSQ